jgi:hypothetical protein
MIELALLAVMVIVLVVSLRLLRKGVAKSHAEGA